MTHEAVVQMDGRQPIVDTKAGVESHEIEIKPARTMHTTACILMAASLMEGQDNSTRDLVERRIVQAITDKQSIHLHNHHENEWAEVAKSGYLGELEQDLQTITALLHYRENQDYIDTESRQKLLMEIENLNQREKEYLRGYPEGEWGRVAGTEGFHAIGRAREKLRQELQKFNRDGLTEDLPKIARRLNSQAYENGKTKKEYSENRLTRIGQKIAGPAIWIRDAFRNYGVKPTIYMAIPNLMAYLPPAYAAAFTAGGESSWFTNFIDKTGIPEYDSLVQLGYLFALIEATTTPIPMVPGVAGLTRFIAYTIGEGFLKGNHNHTISVENGEKSIRSKNIRNAIVWGLPIALDGMWTAIPITEQMRNLNADVTAQTIFNGYRLNRLLNKYGIDLAKDYIEEPV